MRRIHELASGRDTPVASVWLPVSTRPLSQGIPGAFSGGSPNCIRRFRAGYCLQVLSMKLLFSSFELEEIQRHVKRLVFASIRCSVCRNPGDSSLSVWINDDTDFPRALKIFMNRSTARPIPRWLRVYDFTPTWDQKTGKPVQSPHQIAPHRSLPVSSREPGDRESKMPLAPSVFEELNPSLG